MANTFIKKNKKKQWMSAFGIALGLFAVAFDFSIVNTALAAIQQNLNTSFGQLQWVMNMFGLCVASFLLIVSRMSDRFGRKRFFIGGLFLWIVAALGAGFAPNIYILMGFRELQGLSTAILLPTSQALMILSFPKEQKNKASAFWAMIVGIGLAVDPALGGFIVSHLSWRWIFFIGPPFTIVSIVVCLFLVSESKKKNDKRKMDFRVFALLFFSSALILYSIIESPINGLFNYRTLGPLFLGIIGLTLLIYMESKQKEPLIQFNLFLNRIFLSCSITNFMIIFVIWASFFLIPLYLQTALHYPAYQTGLILFILSISMAFFSTFIGKSKTYFKFLILFGLSLLAVACFIQLIVPHFVQTWQIVIACFLIGTGWGIAFGPSISTGITSLPHHMISTASGALNTFQELGGVLGLAICGVLFRFVENISLTNQLAKLNITLSKNQIHQLHALLTQPEKLNQNLQSWQ